MEDTSLRSRPRDNKFNLGRGQNIDERGFRDNRKNACVMVCVMIGVVALFVSVLCGTGNCAAGTNPITSDEPLDTFGIIAQRGSLQCGVRDVPFQAAYNETSQTREGFSADLCRAIAAAMFGEDGKVDFVVVASSNAFLNLYSGLADLLISGKTITMERDVFEPTTETGYHFSVPYLYDGLSFGGDPLYVECASNLENSGGYCTDISICVLATSTHEAFAYNNFEANQIIKCTDDPDRFQKFSNGICNVIAGERSGISEPIIRSNGYTGEYVLGETVFTREPLSIVTRDGDAKWSDFVEWILQALLTAEENDIGLNNADRFPLTTLFGQGYETLFQDMLRVVGNYGEIYERNLQMAIPREGPNLINNGGSGLMSPYPFGDPTVEGRGETSGGTLQKIRERGYLICGIARRASFADNEDGYWKGLDVDLCKAISAAIFEGRTDNIFYDDIVADRRFELLQEGEVDVLARITTVTFERDVYETRAGAGFSFSQPYFYDGLRYGGIPPYDSCADNLDHFSENCEGLIICVNSGTTFEEVTKEFFPGGIVVTKQSGDLVAAALNSRECNAVGGGIVDVSKSNIQTLGGYDGPYGVGKNTFSKDPLALVTRQDDPQWSAFCNWIVTALFYAEQEGITQADWSKMPIVNLFGIRYFRMMLDAVKTVGSYEEIYERNFPGVERTGLNELNRFPYGPQHYALPGLMENY